MVKALPIKYYRAVFDPKRALRRPRWAPPRTPPGIQRVTHPPQTGKTCPTKQAAASLQR